MIYKKFLIFDFGASNGHVVIAKYNGKKVYFDIAHKTEIEIKTKIGVLF